MNTRKNPSVYDAHRTAKDDEPIFTLKASDPQAADLVRQWALTRLQRTQSGLEPPDDLNKVIEAFEIEAAMRRYAEEPRCAVTAPTYPINEDE